MGLAARVMRPVIISWAERYMAEVHGAATFLRKLGYGVRRASEDRSTWYVSTYSGEFDNEHLISFAKLRGFEA
jgi:hypothetical protein